MKKYLALAALLFSLTSAVDLDEDNWLDNDDQLDNSDWLDDDDWDDDDELFADAASEDFPFKDEDTYNGYKYLYSNIKLRWVKAQEIC